MLVHPTTPQRALLAPVPCIHLHAGQVNNDRVAFGTNRMPVFQGPEAPKHGMLCLIYASSPGHGFEELFVSKKASFAAIFDHWQPAETFSEVSARPVTTATDTPFKAFWIVRNLIRLPKEAWVEITQLKSKAGNAIVLGYPIGPTLVDVPPIIFQSISEVLDSK